MFDVKFRFRIATCGGWSSDDPIFSFTLALPFPPFPKLEVFIGSMEFKVEETAWVVEDNCFECWLPTKTVVREQKREGVTPTPLAELVEQYRREGWTVDSAGVDTYTKKDGT